MALEEFGGVHAAHAGEFAVVAAGGDYFLVGVGDFRVVEFAGDAALEAEVVGADEQGVDAGDGGDGVGVLDALRRFDHDDDQGFFVDDARGVADGHGGEAELLQAAAHGPLADRRGAAGGWGRAGPVLGGGVGGDESPGGRVEEPRGGPEVLARAAHHRGGGPGG